MKIRRDPPNVSEWDDARMMAEFTSLSNDFANLQREMAKRNIELERANAGKDHLLRTAAHDLRNPLNAIKLFTELLRLDRERNLSAQQHRMLDSIGNSSTSMLAIVESLLDVSVLKGGVAQLNREPVDLSVLASECVALFELLALRKGIRIDLAAEPEVVCSVDRARIEQVLHNVLTNALAYSPPDSVVEIEVRALTSGGCIRVGDRGAGIAEEELGNLFEPFPGISSRPTGGEKSVGLGLAISKAIIDSHDGRIWAESEVGIGTTFFIEVPAAADE